MANFAKNLLPNFLSLPKIEEMRNVMCVQPHPDDIDLSIGGTVAKLAKQGTRITYVTVTDGGAGTLDESQIGSKLAEARKREQEKAAEVLGVSELIWLGYEDLGDYTVEEVRTKLIEIIRKSKPDMLLTVDPFMFYEVHPDHLKCGMAAAQAAFFYRLPKALPGTCDETIKLVGFFNTLKPNVFIEISEEHFHVKMQALSCHRTQFDDNTLNMLASYFLKRSFAYGIQGIVEPLKVLPPIALHVFAEFTEF